MSVLDGDGGGAALPRGDSPLHYSVINGGLESVRLMLRLRADVNRRSSRSLSHFLSLSMYVCNNELCMGYVRTCAYIHQT